jgi:hypothetical protein
MAFENTMVNLVLLDMIGGKKQMDRVHNHIEKEVTSAVDSLELRVLHYEREFLRLERLLGRKEDKFEAQRLAVVEHAAKRAKTGPASFEV